MAPHYAAQRQHCEEKYENQVSNDYFNVRFRTSVGAGLYAAKLPTRKAARRKGAGPKVGSNYTPQWEERLAKPTAHIGGGMRVAPRAVSTPRTTVRANPQTSAARTPSNPQAKSVAEVRNTFF